MAIGLRQNYEKYNSSKARNIKFSRLLGFSSYNIYLFPFSFALKQVKNRRKAENNLLISIKKNYKWISNENSNKQSIDNRVPRKIKIPSFFLFYRKRGPNLFLSFILSQSVIKDQFHHSFLTMNALSLRPLCPTLTAHGYAKRMWQI